MDVIIYGVILGIESGSVEPVPLTEDSLLRKALSFRDMPKRPAPADYEKIVVERVIMGNPDLPGTILRLPMVYGPETPAPPVSLPAADGRQPPRDCVGRELLNGAVLMDMWRMRRRRSH